MLNMHGLESRGMVFSALSFPLANLLDEYRLCFSRPQFRHFVTVIAGLMFNCHLC